MSQLVGLVPARAGSKGVRRKNVQLLAGYPLVAYAIAAGLLSRRVERVLVSTDSEEIAGIARRYGAEVPFLRPPELAGDATPDAPYVLQMLDWFAAHEGGEPPFIIHLRPTTPLRDPALVDEAIARILEDPAATSLRSVHAMTESPRKMFEASGKYLVGLFPDDPRPEYYNLPRQNLPKAYYPNGYVDVLRSDVVRAGSLHGPRMFCYITPLAAEVDSLDDLDYLRFLVTRVNNPVLGYLRERFQPEDSY
jgi:CMP-N,N'-diacetyllegionaminic acid synthase